MVRRLGGSRVAIRTLVSVPLVVALAAVPAAVSGAAHARGSQHASPYAGARKPNIVLILTDDQRWGSLWAMPVVRHRLMGQGVTFKNAYVVNSLCCPSRSSILTGNYSHTTGVYRNTTPDGGFYSFHDSSTIATWLNDAGYDTALIGKYLNHYWQTEYVPPGWDTWRGLEITNRTPYYGYLENINGELKWYVHQPRFYSTTVLRKQAVAFIHNAEGPLFLYFAPFAPHEPGTPAPGDDDAFPHLAKWRPPSYNEKDVSDKPGWVQRIDPLTARKRERLDNLRLSQYQSLLGVDDAVDKILDALKQTGRLQNTMVVLMSDNGVQWGEHRLHGKGVPYEESTHVPLVIRYPRLAHHDRTDDHLALNIDLAPTFAALAGVHGQSTEGMNLLPVIRQKATTWRHDFLIEHLNHPSPPSYCAVHSTRYLYIAYETKERELYDLKKDPYELHNVAYSRRYRAVRHSMHDRMLKLCSPPPPGFDPTTVP